MNKLFHFIKKEKRYYLTTMMIILLFFAISMAQNVIRYGVHASYNPWITVKYLSASLVLFAPFLPFILFLSRKLLVQFKKYYWSISTVLGLLTVLFYYFFSSVVIHLFGFNDSFLSIEYARHYFGKEALYHMLVLIGTSFYVYHSNKEESQELISGMQGRKKVKIKADAIQWVEADDHYLKIHTNDFSIIKRSTLEQMSNQLKPDFVRIHRKFLVNKKVIESTERDQRDEFVILSSGKRLKVGRTYQPINL